MQLLYQNRGKKNKNKTVTANSNQKLTDSSIWTWMSYNHSILSLNSAGSFHSLFMLCALPNVTPQISLSSWLATRRHSQCKTLQSRRTTGINLQTVIPKLESRMGPFFIRVKFVDGHRKVKINISLGGTEVASRTTSLIVLVRTQIIPNEKILYQNEHTWKCVLIFKWAISLIEETKVWIVEQDGKIFSLQAAVPQRWALLLTVGKQVEIVILVVVEGTAFIARSLGIQNNNVLGLLFLMTKEKKGTNSPRNKDPGSLRKDMS